MKNIIVFYGGKSVEHDISVLTAIQTINNINTQKYNVIPIYLTKKNEFVIVKDYLNPKIYIQPKFKYKKVDFNFSKSTITIKGLISKVVNIDCAINCCHGVNGEDGTLNALMNLCNIPITSASILGSSTCMDKVIMKDVFVANSIPCVDYCLITQLDYSKGKHNTIINNLSYPLIVKPANLGSSIGITKVQNNRELNEALEIAFCYDNRVIVEQCLTNFKEINISCLGNEDCELSTLEQPVLWQDFLNFDDKYTQSTTASKILNPNLDKTVVDTINTLSKKMFKVFNMSGVIRIDFMVDSQNKVYVNEINTVPGSLAFYLWKSKYEFFELIDKLIELAIEKHKQQNMHNYNFSSNVLSEYKPNNINKYTK